MTSHHCGVRLLTGLLAAVVGTGIVAPALAQQTAPAAPGPTIDKRLGEEEEIRLRHEWFFSTRRAGALGRRQPVRNAPVQEALPRLRPRKGELARFSG